MSSFHRYETRSKKRKALAVPQPAIQTTLLDLPNQIIEDILLRLPAECVFQCRHVLKLNQILDTTPSFIRRHLARQATASIIALQSFSESSDREIKFYFIDEQTEKVTKESLKLDYIYSVREDPIMLYESYDGFLLLKNNSNFSRTIFVIWNPTTKEQVTILMKRNYEARVCGFYFNPHNKEYELLLAHRYHRGGNNERYAFDILSFGSKLQEAYKLRRNVGICSYIPRNERPPTIINGTLYWMVDMIYSYFDNNENSCSNSIMAFEIGTNTFSTMQHGNAPCNDPRRHGHHLHRYMHLIEMEGQLGLCVLSNANLVLWVLCPATNRWAKTHSVTLPKHSTLVHFSCKPNSLEVEVVKMKDGKFLIRQMSRLLLCDLNLKTHEIVEKKGYEYDNFRPVIHTHSLVSLGTDKLIELES